MRLIDAESVRYDGALFPLRRDGKIESLIPMYAVTRMFIDKMPTIDAVPVVRCKDCKWWGDYGCAVRIVDESDKPKENDFCSFGERKYDAVQ